MRWANLVLVAGTATALSVTACSSGGSNKSNSSTPAAGGTAATSASPSASPHEILVTNDDGVTAPGINALVTALRGIPDVHVTVVAPAKNQSGTGGNRGLPRLPHGFPR